MSARSIERTLQRQREALALLAGTACAGLLLLPPAPERLLGCVAAAAAVGVVVASVARVYERDRGDRSADALIEEGFRYERRSDAVSRAVAERVVRLESDRKRRSLAGALRAHVELDRVPAARPLSGAQPSRRCAASATTPTSSSGSRRRSNAARVTLGRSSRWSGSSPCRRRCLRPTTTGASSAAGFAASCVCSRPGREPPSEGVVPVEVRQAAMIVATTCVVTFAVVLAALLMVR